MFNGCYHEFFLEAISKMPNSPISTSGLNRNPRNIHIYSSGYDPAPSLTSNYFSIFEIASILLKINFQYSFLNGYPFLSRVSNLSKNHARLAPNLIFKFYPINPMTYSVTPKRATQYYALGNLNLVVKTPLLSPRLHTGR